MDRDAHDGVGASGVAGDLSVPAACVASLIASLNAGPPSADSPGPAAAPGHHTGAALLWMVGALLSFLAMALGGRELARDGVGTFQILFFRSIVGLVVIGVLLQFSGCAQLRTRRFGAHLWRNVAHFGGQFGWFVAIALIPLAEVFAIEFTIPVWTALLAVLFLGERLTGQRVLTLVLGIAGVALIVKPGAAIVDIGALAALGGAFGYAVAYVGTRVLAATEAPLSILFWMTLIQLPLGAVGAAWQWHDIAIGHAPWFIVVGLTAMSAHYCLTRALKLAEINVVLPLDFMRLPLVALLGYVLYGERIDVLAIAGAVLIVLANVANVRSSARAG